MGLSIQRGEIRCPIRKKNLAATPEEKIRVQLLNYLISQKGFPPAFLAVEQELGELAHLRKFPNLPVLRRADIVCFTQCKEEGMKPLLLVECKAEALNKAADAQIFGYNQFVKAPFLALVGPYEVRLHAAVENITLPPFEGFPTYQQLKDSIKDL